MNTATGAALGDDEGTHWPDPLDDEQWWSAVRAATNDTYSIDDVQYRAPEPWSSWPYGDDAVPTATSWWINSIGGTNHQTVVAPKVARSAAANPIREHPPVWNEAADTASTPSSEDSSQADAYTDVLAGDWSQAEFSLGRRRRWTKLRDAEAPGRHRREREVVLSPRLLTGTAVFLAGQKRSAVADEWRSHLSELKSQGLTSRGQTHAALGFLWAAVRYRLRDAANLAWHSVDALLRSRTLSNLLVLIPTLMAALYILRHLGTLGVVTSAEGISAIGGGLYGLVRVGRWWRDVKPPEPKARCAKEQLEPPAGCGWRGV
jgi:hypothetical protein